MSKKMIWGFATLIILIIGVSVFLLMRNTDTKTETVYIDVEPSMDNPPTVEQGGGHWHADEWHDAPHPNVKSNEMPFSIAMAEEFAGIPYVRGFTSTNPLFADGVPKHLQCPKDVVGVYTRDVEDLSRIHSLMVPIVVEILTEYNPNRPLTQVWLEYIESERFYYENADIMRADPGEARGRIDWQFQHLLDFPEITILQQTDSPRSSYLRQVLIGHWSPDWNRHELPDGRIFYAGNDYKYQFIFEETYLNSEGLPITTSTGIGFGHAPTSERIQIKLAETTDEELQELGGWNYNLDPYAKGLYTLQPDATAQFLQKLRNYVVQPED